MINLEPADRSFTREEIERHRQHQIRLAIDHGSNSLLSDEGASKKSAHDHRLCFLVLGSGSKGNAAVIYDQITGQGVLIDAGICKRDVFCYSEQGGFDLANLKGIFITHAHSDHVKNIGVVVRGLQARGITVPIYMHERALMESKELKKAAEVCETHFIEAGQQFAVGVLDIHVLPTSHDVEASFGFRVEAGSDAIGLLTDTGIVLPEALSGLRGVRVLGLESNHDVAMLNSGPYPRMLKERVLSSRGHLSNAQAAEALEALASEELEIVVALHISENNNTYRLPVETLRRVVERKGASIKVTCAYQHRPVFITS
jgi:phosphoribosyl 1,2-cyclic phosphodiesterase